MTPSRPIVETIRRDAPAALVTGGVVGVLGGLIGLDGAEFRLPLLVGFFRYGLRPAVRLNLLMSLVTVTVAAVTRLALGRVHAVLDLVGVALPLMAGGMAGAYLASSWLTGVTEAPLRTAIRTLLLVIGALLIAESALPWESHGLPLGLAGRVVVGLVAGVVIGMVSSLLGVAGGELIIPTLILGFGADVKAAGTASLLISLPTILVGLWRQRRHAAAMTPIELRTCVLPMSGGSVLGAVLGGLLIEHVPGTFLKMLLGLVLMASALRVFAPADSSR